jgi:hypothetical protein
MLRADLAGYVKAIDAGQIDDPDSLKRRLRDWKGDADLAGIRDDKVLVNLPAAEREACRALWAEVEALLMKAENQSKRYSHQRIPPYSRGVVVDQIPTFF